MIELLATPLMCMAMNVYHEARNESTMGQLAVAQVVLNRVEDDRFPDDVCAYTGRASQPRTGASSVGIVMASLTNHAMKKRSSAHKRLPQWFSTDGHIHSLTEQHTIMQTT